MFLIPFFTGLLIALLAAIVAPQIGMKGGPIHSEWLTGLAVVLIFFIQGLQLPADQVKKGFAAWKTHLFTQAWMFIVYPILAFLLLYLFGNTLSASQQIGLLYLAALPTTIATNAAFSARAGGNPATALFNIVLGNFLGIFISPAWLAYLLSKSSGVSVNLTPLLWIIFWQLILPFLVGQLFRKRLHSRIETHRALLRKTSTFLVFFMVYAALCNLLADPTTTHQLASQSTLIFATLLLLLLGNVTCWYSLVFTGWSHDLRVASFYSASQKTLAAGLPMAGAVYAALGNRPDLPPLALILIPLLVFHIGQLSLGAVLIPFLSKK